MYGVWISHNHGVMTRIEKLYITGNATVNDAFYTVTVEPRAPISSTCLQQAKATCATSGNITKCHKCMGSCSSLYSQCRADLQGAGCYMDVPSQQQEIIQA